MIKKLILFILFTGISVAFAQSNDSTHYQATLNSTGSINRTNDGNAYLLNNAFDLIIKQKYLSLNAANTWVYGRQNQTITNNDFSSTLFVDVKNHIPHFYYWGLFNYNTSYSLKINNQFLMGAGLAYNIIDRDSVRINLSDGILYDQSDLVTTQNYHTYRNSLRFIFHFDIKHKLTLDGLNFLQSSFTRNNDYIIRSTTTFGIKLQKWISITAALNYNKMSITHSDNLMFTYGLSFVKHFTSAPGK